jgi:hypothetical protein
MLPEISLKFIKDKDLVNGVQGRLLLYCLDIKLASWDCISGMWGKGEAPKGIYKASGLIKLSDADKAFKKEGFAWVLSLEPQFKTDRTDLAIHPDGNIKGTLGCIGIQSNDIEFYYTMKGLFEIRKSVELHIV